MTKAKRILRLYAKGTMTTRQIADRVGCSDAYVRVVARQRRAAGWSDIDRRYLPKLIVRYRQRYAAARAAGMSVELAQKHSRAPLKYPLPSGVAPSDSRSASRPEGAGGGA